MKNRYHKVIDVWVSADSTSDADMYLADFIYAGALEVKKNHGADTPELATARDMPWEQYDPEKR